MPETTKKPWLPKPLSSYTDAQKVKAFDRLYKSAADVIERHREGIAEGTEGDVNHEIDRLGEKTLQETFGEDIFDRWDDGVTPVKR